VGESKKTDAPSVDQVADQVAAAALDEMISKDQLLTIISNFEGIIESEDGKARLKAVAAVEDGVVEDETTKMQTEIIQNMGLDPAKVMEMFKTVLKHYKDDEELCAKFVHFCELESLACDEAEMTPEEFEKKMQEAAKVKAQAPENRQKTMADRRRQMMKLQQQAMMVNMNMEDQRQTVDNAIAKMRTMMATSPQIKDAMITQLAAQGVDVEGVTEPDELLKKTHEQMIKLQAEQMEELTNECESLGLKPAEYIKKRMEELQRMELEDQAVASGMTVEEYMQQNRAGQGAGGALRFPPGTRVLCNMGTAWQSGVIAAQWYSEPNWPPGQKAAYQIKLDQGMFTFAPQDVDHIIRSEVETVQAAATAGVSIPQYLQQHAMRGHGHGQHGGHGQPSATPQGGALRFSPGDKVQCNVGGNQWKGGTIQQLWYSEPHWPDGQRVPYQVKLDDGMLIFAPMDQEQIIRRA